MGTNYYWLSDPCPTCNHSKERLHIGKSSVGWAFGLRVHPDQGLNTLDDWNIRFSRGKIENEYGEMITAEKMMEVITERSHPNGLRRHAELPELNQYWRRTWRGEGTYDYCDYEFS